MVAAAIAFIGADNPRMKHFCQHVRYHDSFVYLGFDPANVQGEFAIIVDKFSSDPHETAVLTDNEIGMIRKSSAIAPVGLARDKRRVLQSLKSAKHWLDLVNDFSDLLSPEDKVHAVKGQIDITCSEQLVGVFAYEAAMTVAPDRINGIVDIIVRHDGIGTTLPLRSFIPRDLANAILPEAMKMARTLFGISQL